MRKGKYSRKNSTTKIAAIMLALVLLLGTVVGGTLAWLSAQTNTVTNTFVAGEFGTLTLAEYGVDISKADGTKSFTVVPGVDVTKDPKVTFTMDDADVDAYVFVKITAGSGWAETAATKSYSLNDGKLTFTVGDDWTKLTNTEGVYYKEVTETLTAASIIKGDTITVADGLTIDSMTADLAKSDLAFKAYAIQKAEMETVADAWTAVKDA